MTDGKGRVLKGWREIADFFGSTPSTVKRWAATKGLPVYRAAGDAGRRGVPVYAYAGELDDWLRVGKAGTEPSAGTTVVAPRRGRREWVIAAVSAVLVALVAIGGVAVWRSGDIASVEAQAAEVPAEARELYLRGTYLWNRRTPEGIAGAIETLTRAIEIHPDYAEAHASLAMTYNLARQYSGMSGWDAYPKAEEHARRAVELDPRLGFAHSVLAFVEFHWLWEVEAGLARFEQALRLDPQSSNTLMWYASSLLHAGRPAEALPLINRAQEADPDSSPVFNMKAMALFLNGQPELATELLLEIIARDPQYAWSYASMAYIQLSRGDYEGYLENTAALGDLIAVPRYRAVAEAGTEALAAGGVEAMAAAMIAVETGFYERGEALAWDIARHHAMVGDAEAALRFLRVSHERHEERLIGLLVDTAFWPIRDDDEFRLFVAAMGLIPAS